MNRPYWATLIAASALLATFSNAAAKRCRLHKASQRMLRSIKTDLVTYERDRQSISVRDQFDELDGLRYRLNHLRSLCPRFRGEDKGRKRVLAYVAPLDKELRAERRGTPAPRVSAPAPLKARTTGEPLGVPRFNLRDIDVQQHVSAALEHLRSVEAELGSTSAPRCVTAAARKQLRAALVHYHRAQVVRPTAVVAAHEVSYRGRGVNVASANQLE